jgi:hypothetical protein
VLLALDQCRAAGVQQSERGFCARFLRGSYVIQVGLEILNDKAAFAQVCNRAQWNDPVAIGENPEVDIRCRGYKHTAAGGTGTLQLLRN